MTTGLIILLVIILIIIASVICCVICCCTGCCKGCCGCGGIIMRTLRLIPISPEDGPPQQPRQVAQRTSTLTTQSVVLNIDDIIEPRCPVPVQPKITDV